MHINCPRCTHIKVTGHRCGSPALRGEHFCYFHARMIKGVNYRVDTKVNPSALLEDAEAIQVAVMDVTTQLIENSIDWRRASLILRALQIAVRNARGVQFGRNCRQMVRQVPNWDLQFLKERGEKPMSRKQWAQPPRDDKQKIDSTTGGRPAAAAEETQQQVPRLALPREARSSCARDDMEKRDSKEQQVPREARSSVARDDKQEPDDRQENDNQPMMESGGQESPLPAASSTTSNGQPPKTATREWRELQRVARSLPAARKGNLSAMKTVFAFAGLGPK